MNTMEPEDVEAMEQHAKYAKDAIAYAVMFDSDAETHRAYLHARWSARLATLALGRD